MSKAKTKKLTYVLGRSFRVDLQVEVEAESLEDAVAQLEELDAPHKFFDHKAGWDLLDWDKLPGRNVFTVER